MLELNKVMERVSVLEKETGGGNSLEQICLNLHYDAAKLWLAARKENTKQDKGEIRKRVFNMFITVMLLFVKVKDHKDVR